MVNSAKSGFRELVRTGLRIPEPNAEFNIIYIMRNSICQCRTHGQRFSKAGIVPSRFQAVTMTSLYKPSTADSFDPVTITTTFSYCSL